MQTFTKEKKSLQFAVTYEDRVYNPVKEIFKPHFYTPANTHWKQLDTGKENPCKKEISNSLIFISF